MVSTDTLDRGGYMGGRCVALTWSSEIDGRPDWPSDHMPAPWPDVWFECSSLSTHCSKVRGSTSVGTGFPHSFTRPPVRTHRGRHPARSGRPRGARRKVTWFRTFTYVLGRSETSPGTSCSVDAGRTPARHHRPSPRLPMHEPFGQCSLCHVSNSDLGRRGATCR